MKTILTCCAWIGITISGAMSTATAEDETTEPVEQRLVEFMNQAAEEGFTGGVIVARGDDLLLRAAYGERVPGTGEAVALDTVSTVGSVTKQFTAAAVMLLEQQGKLSVTDTLGDWFDEVPGDKAPITIHELLSHQSGLPPAIGSDDDRIGKNAWLQQAFEAELLFAPGEGYEYSNVGFSVAAAIIESASGESYETFLRRHFFEPLGMKDTGYHLPAAVVGRLAHGQKEDGSDWGSVYERFIVDGGPGWNLVGNGGIHSTLDDMLRWHTALQNNQILNEASTAKLYGKYAAEPGDTWYGYGWVTETTPWGATLVTHNGGNPHFFADFLRFPEDDIAIYLWTTSHEARLKDLGRPLASIVYGGPAPKLRPPPPPLGPIDTDTAVGKVAANMLELTANEEAAQNDELIHATIHPALIAKFGIPEMAGLFAMIREDLGEYRFVGVRVYPDSRVDIEFDTVKGLMALELGLQDADGPRVRSIGIRAGD